MSILKKLFKWIEEKKNKCNEKRSEELINFMQKRLKEEHIKKYGEEDWERKQKELKEVFTVNDAERQKECEKLLEELIKNKRKKDDSAGGESK